MSDLSPFEFFRQETSNVDVMVRTEAMTKVGVVAALMGPEKTRSDMIPYLLTKMMELDQVLLELSKRLVKFLPLVGGPEQAASLIPLFEGLCEIEEITVRTACMASASHVLRQLGPTHRSQIAAYLEFFKRASNEEAGEIFYQRVSACSIVADLYSVASEADRAALREAYGRLCKDELSIVRRAASYAFAPLAKLVDSEVLGGEMLALLKTLMTDENQTIQAVAIEALPGYAALLKKAGHAATLSADIVPVVKSFSDDLSWRIRQALSRRFGEFAVCFTDAEVAADIFPCLIHLIQDPEPEVRSVAILEVAPFLEPVGTARFLEELAPAALQLAEDPVPNVRKLLAELCVDVAAKVEPEVANQHLADLVARFMDDEDPLVRLRIIQKIPLMAETARNLLTRLTESFIAMLSSTNWRCRRGLLLAMPAVVKHMGQDYFETHFLNPCLRLLKDGVDQVRLTAAQTVPRIAALGNLPWVYDVIFPSIKAMAADDFLVRSTMLTALQGLLALELTDRFQADVVQLLTAATADKVPNIRLRAAQVLGHTTHLASLDSSVKAQLQVSMGELQGDADKDVKYFATLARQP